MIRRCPYSEPQLIANDSNCYHFRFRGGNAIRFASFVLGSLLLISCGGEQEPEPVIRPVRYVQVFSTGGSRVRTFSGTARSAVESPLSFKVPGTIRRLPVEVGDSVRAGRLIADLDPADHQLQVQEAQASLAQARAQERNAAAEYERVRLMWEDNNASKSALDAARAASESAEATMEVTEQRLEIARLQLSYTRLTAPVAGAVAEVSAEVNQNVNAGQVIVLLTSGSRLEVVVAVPEVLISRIREGSSEIVTFDAMPDRTFPATVTEVGVTPTAMGTTFPVIVLLDEPDPDIRSGMAAEVGFRFESADPRERFLVPPFAVAEDRDGRFVYIVEPTEPGLGIAHRRSVDVGELTSDGLEVFQGLSDGDLLVSAGISRIQEGLEVKLLGAEPAGS